MERSDESSSPPSRFLMDVDAGFREVGVLGRTTTHRGDGGRVAASFDEVGALLEDAASDVRCEEAEIAREVGEVREEGNAFADEKRKGVPEAVGSEVGGGFRGGPFELSGGRRSRDVLDKVDKGRRVLLNERVHRCPAQVHNHMSVVARLGESKTYMNDSLRPKEEKLASP